MSLRYCRQCGTGYTAREWADGPYCGSCGTLLHPARAGPIFEQQPQDGRRIDWTATARHMAKLHPWIFSAGSIGAGVGCMILASYVLLWAQVIAAIGILLTCFAMISIFSGGDQGDGAAGLVMAAGMLLLLGSAGVVIAAVIGGLGVCAFASGTGVAFKEGTQAVLAWRKQQQLREKGRKRALDLIH